MVELVYKIVLPSAWTPDSAVVPWAEVDQRDGFVHLSTAAQVRDTATRHFREPREVWLLEVAVIALAPDTLRWEPSRGGQLFPHVYGDIPRSAVRSAWLVSRGDGGSFEFPSHI